MDCVVSEECLEDAGFDLEGEIQKQMLIAELEEILNVSEVENRSFNEA